MSRRANSCLFCAIVLACLFCIARARTADAASPAAWHLDPSHADLDARAALASHGSFCTAPSRPLSLSARELCPLAGELEGCEALAQACDEGQFDWNASWVQLAAMIARVGVWAMAVGAIGGVVFGIVVLFRRMRQDEALREALPKEAATGSGPASQRYALATTDAELLLRHAADHATAGRLDAALFTYLGAALSALDHRGAIRLARHTTHGEYVRGCREDAARPPLRGLVRDVDRVQFGGVPSSVELVVDARARAIAVVRGASVDPGVAVRAATLVLLVLTLAGCTWNPLRGGDDPAGQELLVDVLQGQGAEVSDLAAPLVKLRTAEAGDAIVIVDTDRTALDDETRAHLMRWVEAGGELVLAGRVGEWPADLGATAASGAGRDVTVVGFKVKGTAQAFHGKLASGAAMTWAAGPDDNRAIASFDSGELYAGVRVVGAGRVLAMASHDLLTNVGLATPGNASVLVALLVALEPPGLPAARAFRVARPEQGVSPPGNPLAALVRVGLGPALAQGLVFAMVLFAGVGVRQSRPKPEGPSRRRAFAEHVEATGALYARTRAAGHALAAYARYADERLRAKMPRGSDPASLLALRAGADPEETSALYARAMAARSDDPRKGDELATLRQLSGLFVAAMRRRK